MAEAAFEIVFCGLDTSDREDSRSLKNAAAEPELVLARCCGQSMTPQYVVEKAVRIVCGAPRSEGAADFALQTPDSGLRTLDFGLFPRHGINGA